MNEQQVQITTTAMLAALLFNAHKKQVVTIKPDDASPEVRQEVPMIGIELQKNGDAVICTVPLKEIMHFALVPYEMQFQVIRPKEDTNDKRSVAVIVFEKQQVKAAILATNGKPIQRESEVMKSALERIK